MCVAENQAGSAEKLFTLRVQGEMARRGFYVFLDSPGGYPSAYTQFKDSSLAPAIYQGKKHLGDFNHIWTNLKWLGAALGGCWDLSFGGCSSEASDLGVFF